MWKLWILSAMLLVFSVPAFADQDSWQGTDLYNRTLVTPDSPRARQSRPLYTWRDGSQHTITEPPPRPKFRPSTGATTSQNYGVRERNAPRDRRGDNGQRAELGKGETDPRFCVTHTRTASALDRCVRAQHGEPQAEDYHWVPGPINLSGGGASSSSGSTSGGSSVSGDGCGGYSGAACNAYKANEIWSADRLRNGTASGSEKAWYGR